MGVVFFLVFRLLFIFLYSDDISETTKPIDYFEALFMGFRFDMTVVCYFLAVPVLTTFILTPFKKYQIAVFIRTLFQSLFVILSVFISVITYNYYKEYKDQFNHFLFMGLYDDKSAVIQSIIADFHPVLNLFIILITTFTAFKILNHFEKGKNIYKILSLLKFRYSTIFVGILALILFIGAIRGSFTEYPVRRFYASITSDTFLNKTIINPFRSLNNAIADYEELNKIYNDNPFQEIDKPIAISEITKSIKKQTKTRYC